MTFIDVSQGRPSTALIAGYSILCIVSVLCAYWAVNLGRTRLHYRSFFSVRVLFPLALFILALENATLASSGILYDKLLSTPEDENYEDGFLFIKAVFVLQTFIVPILLITMFEITYLVHKRRSVNFCGMYFDEGVRLNNTAFMSFMLRNSIRTLAVVLLIMGLIVNFDLVQSGDKFVDELAGRAGWWALQGKDREDQVYLLWSLIPVAVLTLVSFYLSIMLWRYGTESAMVVHSSICNPWFYSFFGTLAMAIGQLFGPELYTIMSNAGMLIFIITILLVMAEVDKDISAANDVAGFLIQVAKTGDQLRVAEAVSPSSSQPLQNNESAFHEEEKIPKDEETGGGDQGVEVAVDGEPRDQQGEEEKKSSQHEVMNVGEDDETAQVADVSEENRPSVLIDNTTRSNIEGRVIALDHLDSDTAGSGDKNQVDDEAADTSDDKKQIGEAKTDQERSNTASSDAALALDVENASSQIPGNGVGNVTDNGPNAGEHNVVGEGENPQIDMPGAALSIEKLQTNVVTNSLLVES